MVVTLSPYLLFLPLFSDFFNLSYPVEQLPIIFLDDLAILEKAAEIHANLRLRGLPIQTEDILIAASAIVKDLIVVSNDTDLARVEGLNLENWIEL